MKTKLIILMLIIRTLLFSVEIYDVQYTTTPGNDQTYPSNYENQSVTLTGIVSANNYSGEKYFINSPNGGGWSGILIYDTQNVNIGDEITLSGTIIEYYGLTELSDVNTPQVLSTNNTISPTIITTGDLATLEDYEGVLVTLENVSITESYNQWGTFFINDGSGIARVGNSCFSFENTQFQATVGTIISSITGVVNYSYGEFYIHPRSANDMIVGDIVTTLYTDVVYSNDASPIDIPLKLIAEDPINISNFSLELAYNSQLLDFQGVTYSNALFSEVEYSNTNNTITINSSEELLFSGNDNLFNLTFLPLESGHTSFYANECLINQEAINSFNFGDVNITLIDVDQADMLTTIQRPILTIPQLTFPNQNFEIWASAPEECSNWSISLEYDDYQLELEIVNSTYDTATEWHIITVNTPTPPFYELFDLVVSADGIDPDRAKNAVQIEENPSSNWSFIQITDTHLATHLFSHDDNYFNDMSEVEDLMSVIADINIINPNFVILTGDLVNEGELEEYLNARYFSIGKNSLGQLNVPVYLVSGNHDIGGWDDTPMPAGTSRLNWYHFFGWDILENPNGIYPYRTQNYSFTYNDINFMAMESYVNYENYLPEVYDYYSFTDNQMEWLSNEITTDEDTNVLFYHYDFSEQINLSNLNLDMVLYGHTHSDEGSITSAPYNIGTKAVCDSRRGYRVIKVVDNVLQPQESCSAGSNGESFTLEFSLPNMGFSPTNSATITNNQSISFNDILVKFIMPINSSDFEVTNGAIEQIIETDGVKVIYVTTNIGASSEITVSIEATTSNADENVSSPTISDVEIYPNPSRLSSSKKQETTIRFNTSQKDIISVNVYNIKGQKVDTLLKNASLKAGENHIVWKNSSLANGIYFIRISNKRSSTTMKHLILK